MSWRRRDVLAGLAAAGALTACGAPASTRAGAPETPEPATDKEAPMDASSRMPVLFVGHGSPMNAIEDNRWAQGFAALSEGISRPKAILAISAHWFVPGTYLTSNEQPPTIHDFGGFPQALYEVQYPARGSVDLAKRVRGLLAESGAELRSDWGLDHGTWSVLRHMYPDADVPVVQLSIDRRLRAAQHLELARSLADLRDEGVVEGRQEVRHRSVCVCLRGAAVRGVLPETSCAAAAAQTRPGGPGGSHARDPVRDEAGVDALDRKETLWQLCCRGHHHRLLYPHSMGQQQPPSQAC